MAYKVYGLLEKGSDVIKYIGVTSYPLKHRLKDHLSENGKQLKCEWIRQLKAAGSSIDIVLIEDNISKDDAIARERHYISFYKSLGNNLVNSNGGGAGLYDAPIEIKQKAALAAKGRIPWNKGKKLSESHRLKIKNRVLKTGYKCPQRGKPRSQELILKASKPIDQFDLQGNFIKQWPSQIEAERTLKVFGVSAICKGHKKQSKGFTFKYSTDGI